MKPVTIYQSTPIKTTTQLWGVHYFFEKAGIDCANKGLENQDRVVVKEHFSPYIDGSRSADLYSIWFQNRPVMICKTGGRPDYEHFQQYVTDKPRYLKMIQYLKSLEIVDVEEEVQETFDPFEEIKDLNRVYCFEITEKDLGPVAHARYAFHQQLKEWNSDQAWPYPGSFHLIHLGAIEGLEPGMTPTLENKKKIRWIRIQQKAPALLEADPQSKEIVELILHSTMEKDAIVELAHQMLKAL